MAYCIFGIIVTQTNTTMKNNLKTFVVFISVAVGILATNACKKEATGTDKELYEMAKASSGFTWYNNSDALLNKSAGSGHPQPFLRTRYNSVASSILDTAGKVQVGATFPEGSLIVKELYSNSNTLARYAILYKMAASADADARGWVWGYVNSDGTVAESSSKKGSACISCHLQANNIDYTLMNKYFP